MTGVSYKSAGRDPKGAGNRRSGSSGKRGRKIIFCRDPLGRSFFPSQSAGWLTASVDQFSAGVRNARRLVQQPSSVSVCELKSSFIPHNSWTVLGRSWTFLVPSWCPLSFVAPVCDHEGVRRASANAGSSPVRRQP